MQSKLFLRFNALLTLAAFIITLTPLNLYATKSPKIVPLEDRVRALPAKLQPHAVRLMEGYGRVIEQARLKEAGTPAVSPSLVTRVIGTLIPIPLRWGEGHAKPPMSFLDVEGDWTVKLPLASSDDLTPNAFVMYMRALILVQGLDGRVNQRANGERLLTVLGARGVDFDAPEMTGKRLKESPFTFDARKFADQYGPMLAGEADAKDPNPIAQYLRGLMFYYGVGEEADAVRACVLLKAAANHRSFGPALKALPLHFGEKLSDIEKRYYDQALRFLGEPTCEMEATFSKVNGFRAWDSAEVVKYMKTLDLLPGTTATHRKLYNKLQWDISSLMRKHYQRPLCWTPIMGMMWGSGMVMLAADVIVGSFLSLYLPKTILFAVLVGALGMQIEPAGWHNMRYLYECAKMKIHAHYGYPMVLSPTWRLNDISNESAMLAIYLTLGNYAQHDGQNTALVATHLIEEMRALITGPQPVSLGCHDSLARRVYELRRRFMPAVPAPPALLHERSASNSDPTPC